MSLKTPYGRQASSPSVAQSDFERQLRATLKHHGQISEGRVYLFSLDRVRDTLGEKWDRVVDKVHTTAQWVIEQKLSPQEFSIRYDETHYVIAFADLDEARARIKLAILARDLTQKLLGSALAESLIDITTAEIGPDGEISLTKSASLEALVRDQKALSDESVAEDSSTIDFIFRPLWVVRQKVISAYFCIPLVQTDDGTYLSGYEVLTDPHDAPQIMDLDLRTLERVAWELGKLKEAGEHTLLSLPVHFETLAVQAKRLAYIQKCSALLAELDRRIIFELVGLPEGVPQSRIQELAQSLRQFARAVMARFDVEHRNFSAYRMAGLHAVGVDIFASHAKEKTVMHQTEEFAEAANRNGLKTYIHGIRTLSMYTAAVAAGFDYVDGYAISSAAREVKEVERFDLRTPYDLMLSGDAGPVADAIPREDEDD